MQIKMDTDAVRSMSSIFRQTADSIDASLDSIKATVESAGWQSQAREEFIMRLEMLRRTSTQSATVLRMMAEAADQKAEQWEAIANVFNGPFHYMGNIWSSVIAFFGGIGGGIWNAITNIQLPSLPSWVLPPVGTVVGGTIIGILPDWEFNPPSWWPFGKKGDVEKSADGGGGSEGGGSWGGDKSEESSNGESQDNLNEGVSEINYDEMKWSEKTAHYKEYQKELLDLEASGEGESERAAVLREEIRTLESIWAEGIPPDGPTPKDTRNRYTGCTNYVANKRDVSGFSQQTRPHACGWDDAAMKAGFDVGKVPVKGSIMVVEADHKQDNGVMDVSDDYGHVLYVEDVQVVKNGYKVSYSHGGWQEGIPQGTYLEQRPGSVTIPFDGHSEVNFIYDKPKKVDK